MCQYLFIPLRKTNIFEVFYNVSLQLDTNASMYGQVHVMLILVF